MHLFYRILHLIARHKIALCDCHSGVCNELMTVYEARYLHIIHYSLS